MFSGKRVNRQYQPHHALQPGTRLQQILWEEGEGEAQQLSARVTRWVKGSFGYKMGPAQTSSEKLNIGELLIYDQCMATVFKMAYILIPAQIIHSIKCN